MKYFIIILFVFAWLNPVEAQNDFEVRERERMAKAKVKTQTQWTHEYVNGKPSAKGYKSQVTKYNTRGNIIEIINYNEKGKVISVLIYEYDNRGNRVNYERYKNNREKLEQSQNIEYDAKGNKIREYGFDGYTMYSNTFKYDDAGKLSEIVYTVDNAFVEKRMFTHKGNKTDIQVFDTSNKLTYRQENTYNDKGLLLTEVKTGGQGNVLHTLDLQYNHVGDLMEETKKRTGDRLDYQKSYQYDLENRLIRVETINLDGTKFVSNEYQYNHLGDVIVEIMRRNEKATEPSTKNFTYGLKGLYTEVDCYYATYKLNSLYRYKYEFY